MHDHKPLFNNADSSEDNVSVLRAKDRKCGIQSFTESQQMCFRCQALKLCLGKRQGLGWGGKAPVLRKLIFSRDRTENKHTGRTRGHDVNSVNTASY